MSHSLAEQDEAGAELETRIEAYLDGALDLEAAREVERELASAAGAALLSRALALRDALAETPGEPPAGLVPRLQAVVAAELGAAREDATRAGAVQVALSSFRWSLSWLEPATYGLGSLRYALGARSREEPTPGPTPAKGRPLWKRLLGLGRK